MPPLPTGDLPPTRDLTGLPEDFFGGGAAFFAAGFGAGAFFGAAFFGAAFFTTFLTTFFTGFLAAITTEDSMRVAAAFDSCKAGVAGAKASLQEHNERGEAVSATELCKGQGGGGRSANPPGGEERGDEADDAEHIGVGGAYRVGKGLELPELASINWCWKRPNCCSQQRDSLLV